VSESCETCKFFKRDPECEFEITEDNEGICRRYPPTVFSNSVGETQGLPVVCVDHWCGEYVKKEDEK